MKSKLQIQNAQGYNRWRIRHPKEHARRNNHYSRLRQGWYDTLPEKIKKLKTELTNITAYLEGRISRLEKIHNSYKLGEIPKD